MRGREILSYGKFLLILATVAFLLYTLPRLEELKDEFFFKSGQEWGRKRTEQINQRVKMANEMQRKLLEKGIKAEVSADGRDSSILNMRSDSFTEAYIKDNEAELRALRKFGFKSVVISNYRQSWTIVLK